MKKTKIAVESRSCDGCTKCCDGYLYGIAHGKRFLPGRPCHFKKESGCSIYESRPENPCKNYQCAWLADKEKKFPEWMKPDVSNVICTYRTFGPDHRLFLEVVECGQKIDSTVLWWVMDFANKSQIPIKVQIGGGINYLGDDEFMKAVAGATDCQ
jgi:hypothetical protein